jgi:hypothetical protein
LLEIQQGSSLRVRARRVVADVEDEDEAEAEAQQQVEGRDSSSEVIVVDMVEVAEVDLTLVDPR